MAKKVTLKDTSASATGQHESFARHARIKSQDDPNGPELIRFDKPTKLFLLFYAIVFILLVATKINFSSLHCWVNIIPNAEKSGLLYGSAKTIRSDEWMVGTTNFLSSYRNGFASQNESFGPGNVQTYSGPVLHWILLFRPAYWGIVFLDAERAFSFYFAFKSISLLIILFLFLKLFTRNNFLISLLGAHVFFLSSAMQWWFSTWLPDIFFACLFTIISFIYLLYAKNKTSVIMSTFVLLFSGTVFVMTIYPPYQVPLGYFFLSAVLGYVISIREKSLILSQKSSKIIAISGVLLFIGTVVLFFYLATHEFFDALANTEYPGKRVSETGGFGFTPAMFSDFLGPYFSDINMPKAWPNVCESSSALMLYPFLIVLYCLHYLKTRKHDHIILFMSFFFLMQSAYILLGFPSLLAKVSLMSMTPEYRADTVLSLCNILFIAIFLGRIKTANKINYPEMILGAIILSVLAYWATKYAASTAVDFFTPEQVLNSSLIISLILGFVVFSFKHTLFGIGALVAMLIYVWPNTRINPIVQGMSPLLNSPMAKQVQQIVKEDPDARWAAMGSIHLPNFLKANGAKVINGISFAPDLSKFRILDPSGKSDSIYNRLGHFLLYPAITPNDTVIFELKQTDLFLAQIDPCSAKLQDLNVKYVSFAYAPQPIEVRCMELVSSDGFPIYKVNK